MVEGYSHESALIQTAECWSITDESVRSLVGECAKIAQIHYKNEHDANDTVVHWEVCSTSADLPVYRSILEKRYPSKR